MWFKRMIRGKKGMEMEEIVKLIIVIVVLVVLLGAFIFLFRGKGGELLDTVKGLFRGGKG
jgi:hypothetical protein